MEAKELIGKSVRGFKFEGSWDALYIDHLMDKFIGEEGRIELVDEDETTALVYFDDNNLYWYPLDQVYNHLVEEDKIHTKISPLTKFFIFLEQNQYFIDDKLVAEYNRLKNVH
jgi:hypothetical protein